jgi:hypothetical protein
VKRLVLLTCLLAAACSRSEPPAAPAATIPPAAAPSPECRNQAAVVSDASLQTGDPASADVDGDGAPEPVAVYFDPAGTPGCQAFLVAAGGAIAGPLETWRPDLGLPAPSLVSLREIDGRPGTEVVVRMGAGASTEFVAIVTVEDGVFRQVSTEVPREVAGGLFGVGGSVGHLEAVDCAPGGGVVASFAAPDGDRYRVERRFLEFEGTVLVEADVRVERVALEEIDRFPEYGASPFGSCSG